MEVKLDMSSRKKTILRKQPEYRRANKKTKTQILNSLVETTGLGREQIARVLRGKYKYKDRIKGIASGRGRRAKYRMGHRDILIKIWKLLACPCSRLLESGMTDVLDNLILNGQLDISPQLYADMVAMGHSTMDRLLRLEREKLFPFGLSTTRTTPGSLIKNKIEIIRGTEWRGKAPGYLFCDLVAHCGDTVRGFYINTLDMTDVASGWTECRAVLTKARSFTVEAIKTIHQRLPFPLFGIHSDNGSEFINDHLYNYCCSENLTMSRGRPNIGNDQCYVEQKNWSVVRKYLGYERFEGEEALDLMNRFYDQLRLYLNFFVPSQKLLESTYIGNGKMRKRHDRGLTPYRRLLLDPDLPKENKEQLTATFTSLNLSQLYSNMLQLLEQIRQHGLGYSYMSRQERA